VGSAGCLFSGPLSSSTISRRISPPHPPQTRSRSFLSQPPLGSACHNEVIAGHLGGCCGSNRFPASSPGSGHERPAHNGGSARALRAGSRGRPPWFDRLRLVPPPAPEKPGPIFTVAFGCPPTDKPATALSPARQMRPHGTCLISAKEDGPSVWAYFFFWGRHLRTRVRWKAQSAVDAMGGFDGLCRLGSWSSVLRPFAVPDQLVGAEPRGRSARQVTGGGSGAEGWGRPPWTLGR